MSANPRQDGCQSGACKRSADQANDVLSYMATLGSGFRGASAAELGGDVWVPPEWSRGGSVGAGSEEPKAKGCQKQGPGCASRACNECADMAVEVLDYMSTLGDGIARATPESVLESRMSGGFVIGGQGWKSAECNACADQADEVMNTTAGFSDGIREFSFEHHNQIRLLGGFQPQTSGYGVGFGDGLSGRDPFTSAATIPSKPCVSDVDCAEVQEDYNNHGTGREFCKDKALETYRKTPGFFAGVVAASDCMKICALNYSLCMGGDDILDTLPTYDPL